MHSVALRIIPCTFWNLEHMRCVEVFQGHEGAVTCLAADWSGQDLPPDTFMAHRCSALHRTFGLQFSLISVGCTFNNKIEMDGLKKAEGIEVEQIKPQADRCIFPAGHGVIALAFGRRLSLGCATGCPSPVMSCSPTNRVLAQLDI